MKRLCVVFTVVSFLFACPGIAILPTVFAKGVSQTTTDDWDSVLDATPNQSVPLLSGQFYSVDKDNKPKGRSFAMAASVENEELDDLSETVEVVFTSEIKELAAELNYNATEITRWVKNNIEYEPYYGSMKGAQETLNDKAGNSSDQTSLLIALLRTSEIRARYVRGCIRVSESAFQNWVGGNSLDVSRKILETNRINSILVELPESERVLIERRIKRLEEGLERLKASIRRYEDIEELSDLSLSQAPDSFRWWYRILLRYELRLSVEKEKLNVKKVEFAHIWAEYMDGGEWILACPAFKQYKYIKGAMPYPVRDRHTDHLFHPLISRFGSSLTTPYPYDIRLINSVLSSKANELYRILRDIPLEEIFDRKEIIPAQKEDIAFMVNDRFMEFPDHMRYQIKIYIPGPAGFFRDEGRVYITTLAAIAGKKLSMYYVPATDADADLLEEHGGINNIQLPYLKQVQMNSVFQIDDEIVKVASYPSPLGNLHYVSVCFMKANGNWWECTGLKRIAVGGSINLIIPIQRTSGEYVKKVAEEIRDTLDESDEQEVSSQRLDLTGRMYFALTDQMVDHVSKLSKIVYTDYFTSAFVKEDLVYNKGSMVKMGLTIDVARGTYCSNSLVGKEKDLVPWYKLTGLIGTATESAVFELMYGVDAMSTARGIQIAAKRGIPIMTFSKKAYPDSVSLNEGLDLVDISYSFKKQIRDYVNSGHIVTTPTKKITLGNWIGNVWYVDNPKTGASSALIYGNWREVLNGGVMACADEAVLDMAEVTVTVLKTIDSFMVAGSMLSVGFAHVQSGAYILSAYSGMLASAAFVGGTIIGLALAVGSYLVLKRLLENIYGRMRMRRRGETAYVC